VWTSAASGIRFDGAALFQRRYGHEVRIVAASRVRELSIGGLLDIRGSDIVDLVLQGSRCEVTVEVAGARDLRVWVRDGIQVAVNGVPHPVATSAAVR